MENILDFPSHRTQVRVMLSLSLLFSLTGNASANAGTPLIIVSMIHLLFGNLIIGIFEGSLLKDFFESRPRWTIPIIILANYASAWSAVLLMSPGWWGKDLLNLDNLGWIFCTMIVSAWALTIVVEWPFIWFCLRGAPGAWKRSFKISSKIQTVSYIGMMALYWFVSGTSLLTGTKVVKSSDFRLPGEMEIYYIAPEDGDVYRRTISGGFPEKVFDLNSDSRWDQLFFTQMTDDDHTDLKATSRESERTINVASGLAVRDLPSADRPEERNMWFNFGKAAKLRKANGNSRPAFGELRDLSQRIGKMVTPLGYHWKRLS